MFCFFFSSRRRHTRCALVTGVQTCALPISRETMGRLSDYATLLVEWQARMNLVGPATLPHLWARHFLDSAQLLDHAPGRPLDWLDLGSGAGFPGLVRSEGRRVGKECVSTGSFRWCPDH